MREHYMEQFAYGVYTVGVDTCEFVLRYEASLFSV